MAESPHSRAESFSPDQSPDLSPARVSERSHADEPEGAFVPQKLKIEKIRELANQSLGDVANQYHERKFPKALRTCFRLAFF